MLLLIDLKKETSWREQRLREQRLREQRLERKHPLTLLLSDLGKLALHLLQLLQLASRHLSVVVGHDV